MPPTIADELHRYLLTGDTDPAASAWTEGPFLHRCQQARHELRGALVAEVLRRSQGAALPALPSSEDARALTRRKVEAMVRGLFPAAEQERVLALVEGSVHFVGPDNITELLQRAPFDGTAWDLANLYLGSVGAELLGPRATEALGMSQEATCYVTPTYLDEDPPFADYVVHEVAHIFHNCKRQTAGLPFTRRKEWMLDIAFGQRETFAWSCEAFARIVERAARFRDRRVLADEFAQHFADCHVDSIDPDEVIDIVIEASQRRNGWKAILARCAPAPRREYESQGDEA